MTQGQSAMAIDWDNKHATGIVLTSRTALAPPVHRRAIPPAKDDRRSAQERAEAAERDEAMSVALHQPHRAGQGGDRRSTPFGRFCEDHKPRRLGDHCFAAGEAYAEIVRQDKTARGFDVIGWAPSDGGYQNLTEAQIQARKDLAISRKKEADEVLQRLHHRLPALLELLVYDQREPSPYREGLLVDGLVLLADKLGFKERSIREEGRE